MMMFPFRSKILFQVHMAPDQEGRPHSPDLLEDESLNDIGVPPELPPGWAPAPLGTEGTPLRALIPGEPHLPSYPCVQLSPDTIDLRRSQQKCPSRVSSSTHFAVA